MIIREVHFKLRPSQSDMRRLKTFTTTEVAHITWWSRDCPQVLIEEVISDCLAKLESLEIISEVLLTMTERTKRVILMWHCLGVLQPFVLPSEGCAKCVAADSERFHLHTKSFNLILITRA
jgi:hypothetical protein